MGVLRRAVRVIWFPGAIVAVWEVLARIRPNPFFTAPSKIFASTSEWLTPLWWVEVVMPTVMLCVGGYVLGGLTGVVLGTLIGSHPWPVKVLGPVAVFVRSTPAAATIPVILGILGLGSVALYVAVTMTVGFQVLLVTMLGVSRTEASYRDSAKLLDLTFWESLFLIRFPAAMSDVLVALQSAVQTALLVAVTVEILAGGSGIGRFVSESLGLFRMASLWWAVIVVGLLGIILHELYFVLERRVAPWLPHQRGLTRA